MTEKERKQEQRAQRLQQRDVQTRKEMREKVEKRDKKLKEPFAQMMCRRLFMAEMVFVVCFGALEVYRLATAQYTASVAYLLVSLLLGTVVLGLPVLLICARQFRRHRQGETETDITQYQWYARITLILLLVLLVCWAVAAIAGW